MLAIIIGYILFIDFSHEILNTVVALTGECHGHRAQKQWSQELRGKVQVNYFQDD